MSDLKVKKMKSLVKTIGLVILCGSMGACCKTVEQGDFSIQKGAFSGHFDPGYKDSGLTNTFLSDVYEINGKQILIDVGNLQPKDKDGILLKDMNLTITYKVNPKNTVDFVVTTGDIGEYKPVQLDNSMGSEILGENYVVGYNTMKKETSTIVQRVTREWSSLDILNDREAFENAITKTLNVELKEKYGDVFEVLGSKTYTIKVGEVVESRIQAIAAAQTATAKADAEMASVLAQKRLMLQQANMLVDVSKESGLSVDDLLRFQQLKVLQDRDATPMLDVGNAASKPKGP